MDEKNSKNQITKKERLTPVQAEFLLSYPENNYNVSKTCDSMKIPRSLFRKWKRKSKVFREKFSELEDALIDSAEESLHKLVKVDGNFLAIKYVLDHMGKKRGWGDAKEEKKKQEYPQMTFYCENILLGRDKNGKELESPIIDINSEESNDE